MSLVVLVVAVLAASCGDSPASPSAPDAMTGRWGGDRVRLTLSNSGGHLEFDCARGEMTSPLVPRSDGSFSVPGFYGMEGGPARDPIERQPATFSGRVDGSTITMSLTVLNQPLGPYTLIRDRETILRKCL